MFLLDAQVATVQRFRKSLPEDASVVVCKNTLMRVASNEVEGWSALADPKGTQVDAQPT